MTREVLVPIEVEVPEIPKLELPETDGMPMEDAWHRLQMNLLIDSLVYHWRDRNDFFVAGNMFIYYSLEQAQGIIQGKPYYRGPDFFVVLNTEFRERSYWVVWEEDGRYPDVIIEFLSPSTARIDKTIKKELYEKVFHTDEYFWYEPRSRELAGFELIVGEYHPKTPNERGWLWSEKLGLWIGEWEGEFQRYNRRWIRFYTPEGELVLTHAEAQARLAEAERQRAEQERQRAEQAEAEVQRLRERLKAFGVEED